MKYDSTQSQKNLYEELFHYLKSKSEKELLGCSIGSERAVMLRAFYLRSEMGTYFFRSTWCQRHDIATISLPEGHTNVASRLSFAVSELKDILLQALKSITEPFLE